MEYRELSLKMMPKFWVVLNRFKIFEVLNLAMAKVKKVNIVVTQMKVIKNVIGKVSRLKIKKFRHFKGFIHTYV